MRDDHGPPEDFDHWFRSFTEHAHLGSGARRVVRALAASPGFSSRASAAQVAERAAVNAATVVRTARALGFSGWPELQLEIRTKYLSFLDANRLLQQHEATDKSGLVQALETDLASLHFLRRTLNKSAFEGMSKALARAPRVGLLGTGSHIGPLMQFSHVGSRFGLRTELLNGDARSTHAVLAQFGAGDAILILNLWRTPSELVTISELASELGIVIALITDGSKTPLSRFASHLLVCPAEGSSHFPSLVAATSVIHSLLSVITGLRADGGLDAIRYHERVYKRLEQLRGGPG